jgi:general secretion pathway protein H
MIKKAEKETPAMWASNNRWRRHRRRPHARGMTLIELLVVMTILGLLAGLFPLAMQRVIPARRLAAAAQTLTVQLRDLQSQSALHGEPLQLRLEPSGFSVQQAGADDATHIRWTQIEATLRASPLSQPIHTITMYPDGSSTGGEFELTSGSHLTVITVSPLTSHVRQVR